MNRRELLMSALSVGAVAATSVGTSSLALAGVSPKLRRALLSEAWERAARHGEPLLVIVVPDDEHKWERGGRLGIWLNNAPDQDLALLARVQPAAATLEELDKLVPGVKHAQGAWMVLVRVDQDTPTFRTIVVPPEDPDKAGLSFEDFVARESEKEGGLSWQQLQERYATYQKLNGVGRLHNNLVAFRSSVVRVLTSEGLAPDPRAVSARAKEARQRWVQSAPPGTHWATSWGCGTHVEPNPGDDPDKLRTMVACGMGHVQPYEARFIHFWDVAQR